MLPYVDISMSPVNIKEYFFFLEFLKIIDIGGNFLFSLTYNYSKKLELDI